MLPNPRLDLNNLDGTIDVWRRKGRPVGGTATSIAGGLGCRESIAKATAETRGRGMRIVAEIVFREG